MKEIRIITGFGSLNLRSNKVALQLQYTVTHRHRFASSREPQQRQLQPLGPATQSETQ